MIPHSRPFLGPEEEEAVVRVVRSGQLAQGPEVAAFERELAAVLEVPRVVALSTGTAALHLALVCLGVEPGDRVLLPAYSCSALLHAVAAAGALPVLVDCAPGLPDLAVEAARSELEAGRARALVVANPFGRPTPLGPWSQGMPIVEDGTHSLGLTGLRTPAAVYSFYATKMICGGEGGALILRDAQGEELARDLRDYDGRLQHRTRFNYKQTEFTAALLREQLRRLPDFLRERQELAEFYAEQLADAPGIRLLQAVPGQVHYRYVIQVEAGNVEAWMGALERRGVAARRPVFRPLHHYLGADPGAFPHAERFWQQALSLPLYPSLSRAEAEQVVTALRAVLGSAVG